MTAVGSLVLVTAGCSAPSADLSSPVEGIVTALDAPAMNRVESFALRLDSGATLTFSVAVGDPDVTAAELREHLSFALRLRVHFTRLDSGELLADAVEHAAGGDE